MSATSDRNYSVLPKHCRFGAKSGNDLAVDEVEAGIRAGLRNTVFPRWEQEWAAEGDIPPVGTLYVPTSPEGPVGPAQRFADALVAIWDVWTKEARPGWQIIPEA